MSVNTEFRFDPGQILQPALTSPLNRLEPAGFGASLTIAKGQAMAQKTSDALLYPLNLAATDGTQLFKGFSQYPLATDASGNVYLAYSGTAAGIGFFSPPMDQSAIYTGGIFDPADLVTAATGSAVAEVDTITPTNPTTGDIYTVTNASGDVFATFTVGGTQTAAATVTGLTNSWNANPVAKALATASGSSTFILTAKTAGVPLNLAASAVGTGTTALVITTAAVDDQTKEVDTITPTGSVTTGDVYTVTINYPNGTTHAVSATVGATQSATGAVTVLKAAWNADPVALAYAVPTGTATFILTSAIAGNKMNLTASVVGTGTVSAVVVTTPAIGRNINDILPGCPGARILASGFWQLP